MVFGGEKRDEEAPQVNNQKQNGRDRRGRPPEVNTNRHGMPGNKRRENPHTMRGNEHTKTKEKKLPARRVSRQKFRYIERSRDREFEVILPLRR